MADGDQGGLLGNGTSQVPSEGAAGAGSPRGGATKYKKGRSGRYVPLVEHNEVLRRLAAFEGKSVEEVKNPLLVARDAEIAELKGRLEEREARVEVKLLRERVGELEEALVARDAVVVPVDEGVDRVREMIAGILQEAG